MNILHWLDTDDVIHFVSANSSHKYHNLQIRTHKLNRKSKKFLPALLYIPGNPRAFWVFPYLEFFVTSAARVGLFSPIFGIWKNSRESPNLARCITALQLEHEAYLRFVFDEMFAVLEPFT